MNHAAKHPSEQGGADEERACLQSSDRARLTPRELQVLRLISAGKLNKEIALELDISIKTVETHISHIFRKLRVHNRTEAAAWALQHGMTDDGMTYVIGGFPNCAP